MNRRQFLKNTALATGAVTPVVSLADNATVLPKGKAKHCISIWLGGGMSQIDTFDPKRRGDPKTREWGSDYGTIETAVPGVRVVEHLPETANLMERVTAVRTVNHGVIDEHAAAINQMHTGRPVSGTVVYPSLGSIVAHEKGAAAEGAPAYVLIGYPNVTRGPGFLGAEHCYLYLTDTETGPAGLQRPDHISAERQARREALLGKLRGSARERFGADSAIGEYDKALAENMKLGGPEFLSVFDLKGEGAGLRESYGSEFGQRCLLARRLVESGVRFVEVSHNLNFINGTGWDTHRDGQLNQHVLIRELDRAIATLIRDLESKKMLDDVLIVITTEFGRPAGFDGAGGRGHWSKAFSCVLAGGGLNHCGAYGVTDEKAQEIIEHPVSVPDFFATVHHSLGIDPSKYLYDGDRPVPITDRGKPIGALFG